MTIHAAAKASELCTGLPDDRAKVEAVINYLARTVLYDHLKARTIQPGYKPDPDSTLTAKRGICWDFAALVAAMLRAVGVKCRVVIGWADGEYHAWNEALLGGEWTRYDVTAQITGAIYTAYTIERREAIPMTASEKRALVVAQAKPALGRNNYSQNAVKRECVFTPYTNGKYYSDCSSYARHSYRKAGIAANIGGNTVGIYQNKAAETVDCGIKNGVPTQTGKLRVGDLLLFAGTDKSRAYAGYVGHVEMVYRISGTTVTLIGHGSGTPRTIEMTRYCKSRQASKTSTARGNRGLIKVVRFIADDIEFMPPPPRLSLTVGDRGDDVRTMQQALLAQGYKLPKYGADGDYGAETQKAVAAFQRATGLLATGQADTATLTRIMAQEKAPGAGELLVIASVSANVRGGPGMLKKVLGIVKRGERLTRTGDDTEGWFGVLYAGQKAWISAKMAEAVKKG